MSQKPTITVHESELDAWYRAGWSYVSRKDADYAQCILRWEHDRDPVQPFKGRAEG